MTLVTLGLMACQVGHAPVHAEQIKLQDLKAIRREIEAGKLPATSRSALGIAAKSTEVGTRHVAISLMLLAASQHLYSRESIIGVLSSLVKAASVGEAELLAQEAAHCYGIRGIPDARNAKEWARLKADRSANRLGM